MAIVASPSRDVPTDLHNPHSLTWQRVMKLAVRDPRRLCRLLDLPTSVADAAVRACQGFPLFVPHGFVARMQPRNLADPLLRQVLPLAEEQIPTDDHQLDPVEDGLATLQPGLLQKYRARVLLVTTGACAVHCRYCFRRHYPYSNLPKSLAAWQTALDRIRADKSLSEVILSGGDPLTVGDEQLANLVQQLSNIPHLRRLRVHTRLPVMIPERITQELLSWITHTRLTAVVVIHANHGAELDETVAYAVAKLVEAGVTVLNQAVLLRGVNDDLETQLTLCERLVDLRVLPYYLHQFDRVAGAAHFEVPVKRGLQIITGLRSRLPGYAIPRYVQEAPAQPNKIVLA